MSFENIGLFSYSNGKDYFEILRKSVCPSAVIKHIHVTGDELKSITKLCQVSKFDCIILIDELVDSFSSREEIKEIIEKIGLCKVIVLSIWSDTPGNDLILVESKESTNNKCRKILALIS